MLIKSTTYNISNQTIEYHQSIVVGTMKMGISYQNLSTLQSMCPSQTKPDK